MCIKIKVHCAGLVRGVLHDGPSFSTFYDVLFVQLCDGNHSLLGYFNILRHTWTSQEDHKYFNCFFFSIRSINTSE